MWLKEEMRPGRQRRLCSPGGMCFLPGKFPFLSRQLCPAPAVTSKQISGATHTASLRLRKKLMTPMKPKINCPR